MNEIYSAIYTKITETIASSHNEFYDLITGRYYTERAPQEATFPYAVGHLITTNDESTFTEQLDRIIFQFNLYSNDQTSIIELGNMYTKIRELLDNTDLTVTGHTHYSMNWQRGTPRWIEHEEVWQYVVEYELEIEQTRF